MELAERERIQAKEGSLKYGITKKHIDVSVKYPEITKILETELNIFLEKVNAETAEKNMLWRAYCQLIRDLNNE